MNGDLEVLTSLNSDELHALAESNLALSSQARLNDLLARNEDGKLEPGESKELDELLAKVDHLNILKTRARFTLRRQGDTTKP
jgi:hypothetical protein